MSRVSARVPHEIGLVLMHLGDLHAYEKLLVGLIAFGPFVVLFVLVAVMRRRDAAEGESGPDGPSAPERPAEEGRAS